MRGWCSALVASLSLVLQAAVPFDPVKDIPVAIKGGVLALDLPAGVHLKARLLKVALLSPGTLELGAPPPATEQDEAGDPIWRGMVRVELKGRLLEDPVRLVITYQPCTEGPDGRCFLPVKRTLVVPASTIPG